MKNMKNIRKRAISLLLTLVMCLSMVNLTVFADEVDEGEVVAEVYNCGLEEHTHTEECYKAEIVKELVCGVGEGAEAEDGTTHTHTDACWKPVLECGLEETEGHTHTGACYGEAELTCGKDETEGHAHGEDCYETTTEEVEESVLICGLEESEPTEATEGHTHTDVCYTVTEAKELTCGQEESAPTETAEGHTHTDACYTVTETKELTCEQEESAPTEATEGHKHTEACYKTETRTVEKKTLTCGKPEVEAHTHGDECYTKPVICGNEESEAHTHGEGCYKTEKVLICGKGEHTHTLMGCTVYPELVEKLGDVDGNTGFYGKLNDFRAAFDESFVPDEDAEGDYMAAFTEAVAAELGEDFNELVKLYKQIPAKFKEQPANRPNRAPAKPGSQPTEGQLAQATFGSLENLAGLLGGNLDSGIMVLTDDTWASVKKALEAGTSVKLNNNISGKATITITQNVKLDLNGHTMTFTGSTSNDTLSTTGTNGKNNVGKNGSVIKVEFGTFTLNDSVGTGKITGGKGVKYHAPDNSDQYKNTGIPFGPCGGGVFVSQQGKFVMNGGTITGNTARSGGGIFIARNADGSKHGVFEMYGGSVTYNSTVNASTVTSDYSTYAHEGGGICNHGQATINPTKGNITIAHNTTNTVNDLGGGGIFNESKGKMSIVNAIVRNNHADGLGGGVAGCLHSMVTNLAPDTSAIYSNTADKSKELPYGDYGPNTVDHDYPRLPWNDSLKNAGVDFFCAGYSIIGSQTLNGAFANWNGYAIYRAGGVNDPNGTATKGNNNVVNNAKMGTVSTSKGRAPIQVQGLCALDVTNDAAVKAAADAFKSKGNVVDIYSNTSKMHGGGIGCNGLLTFGEWNFTEEFQYNDSTINIQATKAVSDAVNKNASKAGYTFNLCRNENGSNLIASCTTKADGKISFTNISTSFLFGMKKTKGDYSATVYLIEEKGNTTGMKYDTIPRAITITVNRDVTKTEAMTSGGGNKVTTYTYKDTLKSATVTVGNKTIKDGATVKGSTVTLNGDANFTNKMEYGNLKVTKKVAGPGSTTQEFSFTAKIGSKTETFKLRAGESKTFENIPVGTKYTVTEAAVTGYTKSGEVKSVDNKTIVEGNNDVTITNTRDTKSLTVKKTVTVGANSNPATKPADDATYTIKVQLSGSGSSLTNGGGENVTTFNGDGAYTFNLANGKDATITGIPTGTKYTVTEPGYDKDGWSKSGEVRNQTLNSAASVEIKNHYYKPQYTSVEVTKEFITNAEGYKAEYKPTSVTVELLRNGTKVNEATLNEGNGWTAKWENLLVYEKEDSKTAYTYSVQETTVTYPETAGYSVDARDGKIIRVRNANSAEATQDGGKEILGGWNVDDGALKDGKVTITNTWRPAENLGKATLTINKKDLNDKSITIDGVTFELFKEDGTSFGTATTKDGGKATFESMPVGTYTLREKSVPNEYNVDSNLTEKNDKQQWTVTVTRTLIKVEAVDESAPTGNVGKNTWDYKTTHTGEGPEGDLTVYNTPVLGSIKITKAIADGDYVNAEDFAGKAFTFTVTGPDGYSKTVTVKPGETQTLSNLRYGTYTITEAETIVTNYTWKGVDFGNGQNSITVKVETDKQEIPVTATNTYTRDLTDLSVTKTVNWDITTSNAPNPEQAFTIWVTLTDSNGKAPNMYYPTLDDGETEFTGYGTYVFQLKGSENGTPGETAKITKIPAGTGYKVSEPAPSIPEGWTNTNAGQLPGSIGTIAVRPKLQSNKSESFTVVNHYFDMKKTEYTVYKTFAGEYGSYLPEKVTVQLYRTTGGTGGATSENVAIYDLTAADANDQGVWTHKWEDQPLYTKEGGAKYTYHVREISVSYPELKENETGLEADALDGNLIRVRNTANTGKEVVGGMTTDKEVNEIVGGWIVSATGSSITNTWIGAQNIGSTGLEIHKVDSKDANKAIAGVEFTLTGPGTAYRNGVTATTDSKGYASFGGLIEGEYTLTETQPAEGYNAARGSWTVTVKKGELKNVTSLTDTSAGKNTWLFTHNGNDKDQGYMTIANERIMGKISVTKQITGTNAATVTGKTFRFAVLDADGKTVATLDVKAGETGTTEALPYGKYTIVEPATENTFAVNGFQYNGVTWAGDGTVTSDPVGIQVDVNEHDKTYAVTAENSYTELGSLSLTKTVTGIGSQTRDWNFTLTLAGNTGANPKFEFSGVKAADAKYAQNEDGTYTVTMKHGVTLTVTGLSSGTTYEVSEQEAGQDGYSTSASKNGSSVPYADGELKVTGTVRQDEANAVVFTNYLPSFEEYTSISVRKVWAGDEGIERPASVTVQLYRNGSAYGVPVTLSEGNGWQYRWTLLSRSYRWSVDEVEVPRGYSREVTNSGTTYTITNTYSEPDIPENPTPLNSTLSVNKVWEGDTGADRPANISVQIFKDGSLAETVTLSDANGWSWSKVLSEEELTSTWTVGEVNVPEGYTSSVTAGTDGLSFTVTNTYTPGEPDEPENPDIPDENPPLTDLPDENPPLVDLPDEQPPLIDIPDEDTPLIDIPQTGDFSKVWYAAFILSACGLVLLNLKRRRVVEG